MLHKAKTLNGYTLHSLDGEIGKVKEFYFDDKHWTVRYLVADTGNWLPGKQVLISPHSMISVNSDERNIAINLTKEQIENCPSLDSNKPISLQFEEAYYKYYSLPIYWGGPYSWGVYPYIVRDIKTEQEVANRDKMWDSHLRSTHEVSEYNIHASDGEIGHVEDFIIDDETWAIRYMIIDTKNWWPGKKVLVAPQWIERVSWDESKVFINHSRESIKQSPEYVENQLLTRDYETSLHRHYDRQAYWVDEATPTIRSE